MSAKRYPRGMSNRDRALAKAFGKGRAAQHEWLPRSVNPHMPSGDLYAAWDAGWLDADEAYVIAA